MLEQLTPSVFIILAGGFFMLGYLIINQMLLRSMMLIGSAFYIAYIYDRFSQLSPGDFRLVMRYAERLVLKDAMTITREGEPVTHLYFILSGSAEVTKQQAQFTLPHSIFVGEVAYLLDRPSVATTKLMSGSEVIRWDLEHLRRTAPRNPRFKLALDAMLSNDLAAKVSVAVAPQPR